MIEPRNRLFMLLEEPAPVKFHNIGHAFILEDMIRATGRLEQAFEAVQRLWLYLDDVSEPYCGKVLFLLQRRAEVRGAGSHLHQFSEWSGTWQF